jgi:hypothetical protein
MGAVTPVAALMFFRLAILLSLLATLPACKRESYSRSISGFSSADKKVLYDFRTAPVAPSLPGAVTTRKVLSAVFPSYVSDARECKPEQPRQILPQIRGAAEGSFTAPGLKQTVYLVAVTECGLPLAITTRRLAVFTAGTPTANVEAPSGSAILGVYDLDGDRKHELLLEDSGTGPGEIIRVAKLLEFDKDKLATVEDFGQIYDNACATSDGGKSLSASVVYYLPPPAGQKPRFIVELYRAPCPSKGQQPQWTRASGK